MHYNYFRDYDPATGRYVQSDPIGLAAGIDTFSYVDNTPINLFDTYGLSAIAIPGPYGIPVPIVSTTPLKAESKDNDSDNVSSSRERPGRERPSRERGDRLKSDDDALQQLDEIVKSTTKGTQK